MPRTAMSTRQWPGVRPCAAADVVGRWVHIGPGWSWSVPSDRVVDEIDKHRCLGVEVNVLVHGPGPEHTFGAPDEDGRDTARIEVPELARALALGEGFGQGVDLFVLRVGERA